MTNFKRGDFITTPGMTGLGIMISPGQFKIIVGTRSGLNKNEPMEISDINALYILATPDVVASLLPDYCPGWISKYHLSLPNGENEAPGCEHQFQVYVGFRESFEYCRHCDVKRRVK